MKKVTFVIALLLALALSVGSASAAYMQITPSLPAEILGTDFIDFDLNIVNDDDNALDVFQIRYVVTPDFGEIALDSYSYVPILDDWIGGFINEPYGFDALTFTPADYITIGAGQSYTIASFTFTPVVPVPDGLSDLFFDGTQTINGSSVTGIDGGDVVPIPGAVWLLGTGMLGLIGLRRKVAKNS